METMVEHASLNLAIEKTTWSSMSFGGMWDCVLFCNGKTLCDIGWPKCGVARLPVPLHSCLDAAPCIIEQSFWRIHSPSKAQ